MIWIIIIIAFVIRLISLNQSLWLDEAINVVFAKNLDFVTFVSQYPIADFHPPGYFAFLWIWIRIFGTSEIAVRMPSVLFGVATVFLIYLIGKKLYYKKIGIIAALFLSLAPLHIYYSQEARMYSYAAFATTLSIYFLINLFEGKKWIKIGYIFSLGLLLYSDYVAYFILPVQLFYVLYYQRKNFKRFLILFSIGMVLIIPWLFVFPQQFLNGQQTAGNLTMWKNIVGGASIHGMSLLMVKTLIGRISFENKIFYIFFVGLISFPFIFAFKQVIQKIDSATALLLSWVILPPVTAFVISFYIPVFTYFRFIFILPAFYLLISLGAVRFGKKLLIITIIFFEVITSSVYLLNFQFHREDWKSLVSFLQNRTDKNSVVVFENNEAFAPYKYYSNNSIEEVGGLVKIPAKKQNDVADLENLLNYKNNVYLLEYLVDITDSKRLLENRLRMLGFSKSDTYDFRGVGFLTKYNRL